LPQFAEKIKELLKGIVFVGENFVVGLLGYDGMLNVKRIEDTCKESSSKEVKSRINDTVKFDFKEKGKKPVVTKGVC